MKKLMLVALSFAVSGISYAHGPGFFNGNMKTNEGFLKDMNQIHELMHNTSIKGEKLENGVSFEITASGDTTVESIKKRFIDEKVELETYFEKVEVSVDSLDNGIAIELSSADKDVVKRLQYNGSASIYRYLHGSVFKNQDGMGYHGMMGQGNRGFGPGMMGGHGNCGGFGPGMRYQGEGNQAVPNRLNGNPMGNNPQTL